MLKALVTISSRPPTTKQNARCLRPQSMMRHAPGSLILMQGPTHRGDASE
ncbi:unnamed protein product [Periconia digitata]|uniref:Uncharacterized protein n=1 Tax=Periconia digitata TaxID=1303443 RepID=A0A9W4XPZ4_9PLEO|nr:unnamed protein product [Periconia digitata]